MKRISLDIETNALVNPSRIHFAVVRDIDNLDDYRVFRDVHLDPTGLSEVLENADVVAGHFILGFDLPVLKSLTLLDVGRERVCDTLVVSRFLKFRRDGGHSIESYARQFGLLKVGAEITDWSEPTELMLERCINDTLVGAKIFLLHERHINNPKFADALKLEHDTAVICEDLRATGFPFDKDTAQSLKDSLQARLDRLDTELKSAFPPKKELVKVINPRVTKHGTIFAADFNRLVAAGYSPSDIKAGTDYPIYELKEFQPGSTVQIVERLNEAGWKPTEKTDGHSDFIRGRGKKDPDKLARFKEYGWKVSEENLKTVPDSAPLAAKRLAERLILAARVRRLEEWLSLCTDASGPFLLPSIHGQFMPIGTWTQRKATSSPNMQNVPVSKRTGKDTEIEKFFHDLSDKMRALWIAPKGWRLLGTDADGIQMRIFAHYVGDDRLINALISGDKADGTDIHSVHWKALGDACKGRDPAKTFIYAFLLGAGIGRVQEILQCSRPEAEEAVSKFLAFYPGLRHLKETQIPADAARGYFIGLDGRPVICDNEHLMLGGYLQNGESIIMKRACRQWRGVLSASSIPFHQVNDVHDEWQTLVPDDDDIANHIREVQVQSIRDQGRELNLKCPLDGQGIFGYNWKETH